MLSRITQVGNDSSLSIFRVSVSEVPVVVQRYIGEASGVGQRHS